MEKFINLLMMGASGILAIIGSALSLGILALLLFVPFLPDFIVSAVGYCVFFVIFGILAVILSFLTLRATDAIAYGLAFSRFAKMVDLDINKFEGSFFKGAFKNRFFVRKLLDKEMHVTARSPFAFCYSNIFVHGIHDKKDLYEPIEDGYSFNLENTSFFEHK